MITMKYNVIANYDNAKVTVETYEVNVAIADFMNRVENGVAVDLVDGFTGEVLAYANHFDCEEPTYVTDEMSLMILGWLMAENWGE